MAKTTNANIVPYLLFTIAIVAMVLVFVAYTMSTGGTQTHEKTISISASGEVMANPTQSSMSIFLNGTGNTSSSAVANLSVVAGRLNKTLAPFLHGNSSLIQTLSYNVYPVSNCTSSIYPQPIVYPSTTTICPNPGKHFEATEYLTVTIPNVNDTNSALIGASGINGVLVQGVSAKLSALQEANLSQQALTLALSNATAQALALAPGKQVSVANITVQNNYIYFVGASTFSTTIPVRNQTFYPGRATVTKNIYVVFSTH